ncbi:hypothetical protein GLW20_01580 [Virgibacillus halodenitrificans]|nr:hypothetical protein [Virgibacillus halodenitrificans]
MSKFVKTSYGTPNQILKFPDHYVSLPVTVSDAGVNADANGKKIVPAGTILGGGFLADDTVNAVKATTSETPAVSNAEGILSNDVDVTHGPATGSVVIHGFIATDKLPTVPTTEEKAALNQIKFIK